MDTVKGMVVGYEGDSLLMVEEMKNIGWNSPTAIDQDKKAAIKQALEQDATFKPDWTIDPYWFGLALGKSSRLALIADELNEKQIAKNIREILKEALLKWLKG